MAINLNTTTLEEGPVGADEFITNVYRQAGIFKLVRHQQIKNKGVSFPIIPRTTVEEVGETNLKPVSNNPITSLVAAPITLATTVPVSKQLIGDHAGIIREVSLQGASDIAEGSDNRVAGLTPVTGANFGQLSTITNTATLNTKADIYKAYALLAANGSRPTGWFLSTAMWAELSGRVNALGQNEFNVQGDIVSGTIEGMPYATFINAEAVAYVGDFASKAKAGIVYDVEIDINPYGGLGEGADYINLWSRNMIGVRVETAFAFNFYAPAFVKLTLGDSGVATASARASK